MPLQSDFCNSISHVMLSIKRRIVAPDATKQRCDSIPLVTLLMHVDLYALIKRLLGFNFLRRAFHVSSGACLPVTRL